MPHRNISVSEAAHDVIGRIAKHEERTRTAVVERSLRCYLLANPTLSPMVDDMTDAPSGGGGE